MIFGWFFYNRLDIFVPFHSLFEEHHHPPTFLFGNGSRTDGLYSSRIVYISSGPIYICPRFISNTSIEISFSESFRRNLYASSTKSSNVCGEWYSPWPYVYADCGWKIVQRPPLSVLTSQVKHKRFSFDSVYWWNCVEELSIVFIETSNTFFCGLPWRFDAFISRSDSPHLHLTMLQ